MISSAQPYIALWVESLSKNRNLFDIEVPGNMETVAFQTEVLESALCSSSTSVPQMCKMHDLSWTLSKRDFVCSQCCCSNSFLETGNKKRMQHWQKVLDLQLCKITPFLSPSPCLRTQLPAFPRLPDWARLPWVKPNICTEDRRADENKQTEISHVSVAVFPVLRQTFLLGIHRKEKAEGTQILLVQLLKMLTTFSQLKSKKEKAINSVSMPELETVRIGLILQHSKSRSTKQSSAPLSNLLRHDCARIFQSLVPLQVSCSTYKIPHFLLWLAPHWNSGI